jgi:hypothetical protein
MNNDKLLQLYNFFFNNLHDLWQDEPLQNLHDFAIQKLYHFTTFSALFDMLESDSFWFSGIRFSNDSSEGLVIGEDWLKDYDCNIDNFIFCIESEKNLLSQWRGYCMTGGVSIGLDVARLRKYSVLHADFKKTGRHEDIENRAVPILYAQGNFEAQLIARTINAILNEDRNNSHPLYSLLKVSDFAPYIKHSAFHEEKEFRLLFSNLDEKLSKCICFRKLNNGTRLPYIVVKCDSFDISKEKKLNPTKTKIKMIYDNRKDDKTIIIPVYSNQDDICSRVREYINDKHKKDKHINNEECLELSTADVKERVFCDGHLPIRSIMIAPMPDQNRIKEQVSSFCQNKYWLKDVKVEVSDIPYVPSINK